MIEFPLLLTVDRVSDSDTSHGGIDSMYQAHAYLCVFNGLQIIEVNVWLHLFPAKKRGCVADKNTSPSCDLEEKDKSLN